MLRSMSRCVWCVSTSLLLSEPFWTSAQRKKLRAIIHWHKNISSDEQLHFLQWLLNGRTMLYVWSSTVQFLLMIEFSKPIPDCRSCEKYICKGFTEAWKAVLGWVREEEEGKKSWMRCSLQSRGGRGSSSIASWWWSCLSSCGRESWQIFSIREVEVMTYVVCVHFVWDVHDCRETDGSFNSSHGHVAPPFMSLLLLYTFFYKFFLRGKWNHHSSTH